MSYIDKNLMDTEAVVYRGRLHWIVFAWPVIWLFAAIALFIFGGDAAAGGILCFVIALFVFLFSYLTYKRAEFGITNKRVIAKAGFVRRASIEVLLNKVEGIQVDQGIIGRVLNFGSITINGTGGTREPFHKISAPLEFRKKTQEQIASTQDIK